MALLGLILSRRPHWWLKHTQKVARQRCFEESQYRVSLMGQILRPIALYHRGVVINNPNQKSSADRQNFSHETVGSLKLVTDIKSSNLPPINTRNEPSSDEKNNIGIPMAATQKKIDVYKNEIWTIPNMITYTRMICSPFLGAAIYYDYKTVALTGCAIAAFSDWLDGYIAKNYNQMTVLGGMIDPAADKIMIGCLTAGVAAKGLIPFELAALIVGRDVFLLGCSFIIRAMERPQGTPFFDTTYSATFEIIPSRLSKFNTAMQFTLLVTTLLHWGLDPSLSAPFHEVLVPLQYVTAATTLGSLVGYLDGSAIRRLSPTGVGRGTVPSSSTAGTHNAGTSQKQVSNDK